MGLFDKITEIFGVEEDEDEFDDFDEEPRPKESAKNARGRDRDRDRDRDHRDREHRDRDRERDRAKEGNKILNINATTQLEVVLVKPEHFEDASGIADHLNNKRTVVLNLESTNKDISRRLVDFLSGVAYANNGQIKRVANSTFIITPYNVGIVGDLLDELESSGVYF
jgi:cell division inhibitor SepF